MSGHDQTDPATQWHETAAHLVQAHHVDPSLVVADPPGLNQLLANHSSSHQAIASSPELAAEFSHQHEHLPAGADGLAGWRPFPSVFARETPDLEAGS